MHAIIDENYEGSCNPVIYFESTRLILLNAWTTQLDSCSINITLQSIGTPLGKVVVINYVIVSCKTVAMLGLSLLCSKICLLCFLAFP